MAPGQQWALYRRAFRWSPQARGMPTCSASGRPRRAKASPAGALPDNEPTLLPHEESVSALVLVRIVPRVCLNLGIPGSVRQVRLFSVVVIFGVLHVLGIRVHAANVSAWPM